MKCILRALYLLVIIPCLLSSCVSTKVRSLHKDVDLKLKQSEGYLLLGVNTKYTLYKIQIYGEKNIVLTDSDLQPGSNYILINLPEGEYRIKKIRNNPYQYYDFDDDENLWNFNLEANVINYVGHLDVEQKGYLLSINSGPVHAYANSGSFELMNYSSSVLEFLEKRFPNILKQRDVRYKGPGTDDFFDVVKHTSVNHQKNQQAQ